RPGRPCADLDGAESDRTGGGKPGEAQAADDTDDHGDGDGSDAHGGLVRSVKFPANIAGSEACFQEPALTRGGSFSFVRGGGLVGIEETGRARIAARIAEDLFEPQ